MNTVTKKTRVEPDGWLRVQAPPELENQEVDVIIVPQRPPAAGRAWLHGGVCARRFRTGLVRKRSPTRTSKRKLMITAPDDERSGGYECPHLGCDSGPTALARYR